MQVARFSTPYLVNFDARLDLQEIQSLATNKSIRTLQTDSIIPSHVWEILNSEFFKLRPDVELRIYSFHGVYDLSFIRLVPNVRRFSADCLQNATGLEYISSLTHIEKLGVGIRGLENFDFLDTVNPDTLKDLHLYHTKSKKPSLRALERFPAIETLYLEEQQKDIDAISRLTKLQDLTLRSIALESLEFLRNLPDLWSLDIKLGGAENLDSLRNLNQLKYLELWQVRGLSDLDPISEMTGLQFIYLQSLRNVTKLPNLSKLTSLRRVFLNSMKGITDLSALATAPNLEEFVHSVALGFKPADYAGLVAKGTLKRIAVATGSDRANAAIEERLVASGKSWEIGDPHRFTFS